jgi:hypothetical protein
MEWQREVNAGMNKLSACKALKISLLENNVCDASIPVFSMQGDAFLY